MKIYLKFLAVFYFIGGSLHVLDLFDLRLKFSEMSFVWKAWILYLFAMDIVAAVGLWRRKNWGVALFLVVAASQLIAYIGFMNIFGHQYSLIAFHFITLALYFYFKRLNPKAKHSLSDRDRPTI
ncbi:hypothetical protein [Bdellovibrio sp. HCB288]|uniref:hypothetical protein n=1 Tax=Bdellovibrio sp. HCB288 TaxID=3394355 RepID=UPI0039B427D2